MARKPKLAADGPSPAPTSADPASKQTGRFHKPESDAPTLARLGELGEALFSIPEAALALGTHDDDLRAFLRKEAPRLAFEQGRLRTLLALRKVQFDLARTNATMAMFLARTHFDHDGGREASDEQDAELEGAARRLRDKIAAIAHARRARDGEGGGGGADRPAGSEGHL